MDVRFYDYEHELVAIIAHKQSVNWQLCYNDIGSFELHMPLCEPQAKSILEHDYLIAVQGGRAAIIVEKQVSGNDLAIFGRTCNWLLSRRVVLPFDEKEASVTAEAERVMPEYMTFKNDSRKEMSLKTIERTSPEAVSDFVKALFDEEDLGHEVLFSRSEAGGTEWIFRVYEGEEINVLISEAARTASELTYVDSLLEYASCGYYSQARVDGDGNALESVWREVIKDSLTGIYRAESVLDAETQNAAKTELAARKKLRNVTGKLRRLKFGADYNLGDIVCVQTEQGSFRAATRCRVTGVHIWEESTEEGEEPILEVIL